MPDLCQGQRHSQFLSKWYFHCLMSLSNGQIGFLRDLRRMNVAITRARMKPIILGNADTMTRHPFYRRLWDYIQTINHDNQS